MKKRIVVDSRLCNGCRICTMACSLKKSGKFNPFLTGIRIDSDNETGNHTPRLCRQCLNPVCVTACPAETAWKARSTFDPPIYQDEETGVVQLDSGKESCIGCMACMDACPFGAIGFVPEDQVLVKCDICGGDPECVKFCPKGAVQFLEITKTKARKRRNESHH